MNIRCRNCGMIIPGYKVCPYCHIEDPAPQISDTAAAVIGGALLFGFGTGLVSAIVLDMICVPMILSVMAAVLGGVLGWVCGRLIGIMWFLLAAAILLAVGGVILWIAFSILADEIRSKRAQATWIRTRKSMRYVPFPSAHNIDTHTKTGLVQG